MIHFISDTHFGHKNIIKYCNLPFLDVEEMDEVLIKNWNNVVDSKDTVYHLGDFSFRDPNAYVNRLKGKIVLIRGGHDFKFKNELRCFNDVFDLKTIKIKDKTIVLCHYCLRVWDKSHYNSWHLFGHSHGKLESIGKSHDVSVNNIDFKPISFENLEKTMQDKPDNFNLLKTLH